MGEVRKREVRVGEVRVGEVRVVEFTSSPYNMCIWKTESIQRTFNIKGGYFGLKFISDL